MLAFSQRRVSGWVSSHILTGEILQENLLQVPKGFRSCVKMLITRKYCILIRLSVKDDLLTSFFFSASQNILSQNYWDGTWQREEMAIYTKKIYGSNNPSWPKASWERSRCRQGPVWEKVCLWSLRGSMCLCQKIKTEMSAVVQKRKQAH